MYHAGDVAGNMMGAGVAELVAGQYAALYHVGHLAGDMMGSHRGSVGSAAEARLNIHSTNFVSLVNKTSNLNY